MRTECPSLPSEQTFAAVAWASSSCGYFECAVALNKSVNTLAVLEAQAPAGGEGDANAGAQGTAEPRGVGLELERSVQTHGA